MQTFIGIAGVAGVIKGTFLTRAKARAPQPETTSDGTSGTVNLPLDQS